MGGPKRRLGAQTWVEIPRGEIARSRGASGVMNPGLSSFYYFTEGSDGIGFPPF